MNAMEHRDPLALVKESHVDTTVEGDQTELEYT